MQLRSLVLFISICFLAAFGIMLFDPVVAAADDLPQTGFTPISPVVVSTPNPDGSIIHIVQYGQSLIMISESYNIPMSQIRTLNGMPEGISDIYQGQRLIIRVALPPTETPTWTPTIQPPTRTPRLTTPIMTPTPLPSPTATPVSFIPRNVSINRREVGLVMISVGLVGLLAIGLQQFLSKNSK